MVSVVFNTCCNDQFLGPYHRSFQRICVRLVDHLYSETNQNKQIRYRQIFMRFMLRAKHLHRCVFGAFDSGAPWSNSLLAPWSCFVCISDTMCCMVLKIYHVNMIMYFQRSLIHYIHLYTYYIPDLPSKTQI